jgi:Low psii accumulation1 / Rep27
VPAASTTAQLQLDSAQLRSCLQDDDVRPLRKRREWLVATQRYTCAFAACSCMLTCAGRAQDDDLRPLRERREWLELQDELTGATKRAARQKFRAEAKAPFRLTRTAVFGGLALGAGLGLLIITTRLVKARPLFVLSAARLSFRGVYTCDCCASGLPAMLLVGSWLTRTTWQASSATGTSTMALCVYPLHLKQELRSKRNAHAPAGGVQRPGAPTVGTMAHGFGTKLLCYACMQAVSGGPDAPNLGETAQNFGVNAAALALLLWLVSRELAAGARDSDKVAREDELGRLQARAGAALHASYLRRPCSLRCIGARGRSRAAAARSVRRCCGKCAARLACVPGQARRLQ